MIRLLGRRSAWLALGLFALVEAVFLAESFTTLMGTVVSNGGSAWDLALLLALKSPEVIDFALPLILLLALFFAISGARDDAEFVVCAAAGVSWTAIPRFAMALGLAGVCVSVLSAGFLTPAAAYLHRIAVHELEARRIVEEITTPSQKPSLRSREGRTVITGPAAPGSERGSIFIFEPDRGQGWRVSQADDWSVEGPFGGEEGENGDGYAIRLVQFRDYSGRTRTLDAAEASADDLPAALSQARLTVQNVEVGFRLDQLVKAAETARRGHEAPIFTLDQLSQLAVPVDRRLGTIVGRALVCLFAALVAVGATGLQILPGGRLMALPVAVMLTMGADVTLRTVLGDAADADGALLWPLAAMAAGCVILLPGLWIRWCAEALITPRRGQVQG